MTWDCLPKRRSFLFLRLAKRYSVIIDKELFTYTGVTPDSQGRRLTGVMRAQNGSVCGSTCGRCCCLFCGLLCERRTGYHTGIDSEQVRGFCEPTKRCECQCMVGTFYPTKNQRSIDENGEFTFDLQNSLLSKYDQAWAELIGDTYLDELSDLKELLQATLVFSPSLAAGAVGRWSTRWTASVLSLSCLGSCKHSIIRTRAGRRV